MIEKGARSLGRVDDDDDDGVKVIGGKRKSNAPPRTVALSEVEVALPDGRGVVDVLLDVVEDSLLASLSRVYETDREGNEVDFLRKERNDRLPKKQREAFTKHKELMASMRVTRLMLNRLTGLGIDAIVEEKSVEARILKLGPIIDQVCN